MPSFSSLISSLFTPKRLAATVFEYEVLDERPGFLSAIFSGDKARGVFASESGGHRWQRVSPTERRGRVHTSTVTVAVLDADAGIAHPIKESEIEFSYVRGTGPGGQHRNTTNSCVIAKHKSTGQQVRIDLRSQHQSKAMAIRVLAARVDAVKRGQILSERNDTRRGQVGSGMRGDKIRTYRTQDNVVTDTLTGRKRRLDLWMRGEW